jgi:hypothetical protein
MTLKSHFREAKGIISDSARLKLEGRIYPAIKSCVRNRYLIISGYLAYAGFLVSNPAIKQRIYGNLLREIFVPSSIIIYCILTPRPIPKNKSHEGHLAVFIKTLTTLSLCTIKYTQQRLSPTLRC